jgi:hypothetical protein
MKMKQKGHNQNKTAGMGTPKYWRAGQNCPRSPLHHRARVEGAPPCMRRAHPIGGMTPGRVKRLERYEETG